MRKLLNILNSKPVIGALIFIVLSLATVFAGNVIVKEGSLSLDNNLNSSGVLYVNGTSGKVGIGTTSPASVLDIQENAATTYGIISLRGNNRGGELDFYNNSALLSSIWATASKDLNFAVNGGSTPSLYIKSNDNVGIGTTNPGQKLSVVGAISQTNAVSCTLQTDASGIIQCTSDERLKDIRGNSNYGVDEIMKINPIIYNFKNESYTHIGFSAQNIQTAIPEAVPVQTDNSFGLDNTAIIATLVNAVKELKTENTNLKTSLCNLGATEWC